MVGTISFDNKQGERQHTIYLGATPEYGKATFWERMEREIEPVKSVYPQATYVGIADGAKDIGSFLEQHTQRPNRNIRLAHESVFLTNWEKQQFCTLVTDTFFRFRYLIICFPALILR